MKKEILMPATGIFFLLATSGCQKIVDSLLMQTVTTDYTTIDFTVAPALAGSNTETLEVITSKLDSLLQDKGFDIGKVNSVKITDALIELVDNGNLDPFESFLMTIEATGKTAVTIAEAATVPTGVREIALISKGADLSGFLKSDHYTIKIKTVLDQNLQTRTHFQAKVRYEIKVKM